MKKIMCALLSSLLIMGAPICGSVEFLKKQDINRIMGEIFAQHVDKKEMTSLILKNAIKVYIDQFDPERIYLLKSEVQPFETFDDTSLNNLFDEYRKNNFEIFDRLDATIQKAIMRAKKMRKNTAKNPAPFFDDEVQSKGEYSQWSDPDLKLSFAESLPELQKRMNEHLERFINMEKQHFGEDKINRFQAETLEIYDKHLNDFENHYLYNNEANQPLAPIQKENLFAYHILKALASSLDAHTTVLNPAEAYDMRVRLEKGFEGVGIGLRRGDNGSFIVSSLVEDSPAANSKQVQVGDYLLEVNAQLVERLSMQDVIDMLKGTANSEVQLVFKRGQSRIPVTLKRDIIAVQEDRVESSYEPFENGIIAKITLHSFYQGAKGVNSENDLQKAILELSKKGVIKGLILDLRENSGGFLNQAVKVAGLFITNGVVVVSKYSNGEEKFYRDMDAQVTYDGPLIILTSKATASAAEIVAQSLQDYGVALIVGDEHTYGKGTIQSQTVTDNNSPSYFKVTVGKYYTVSGKTPQIQGVKADIVVPSPFLDEHIGEEFLEYSLSADAINPSFNDPLKDIDPKLKAWYAQNYSPSLQQHTEKWRALIPELKKRSSNRLTTSDLYNQFMKVKKSTNYQADKIRKQYWIVDVQMQEAVDIIKDMVNMQTTQTASK